MPTRTLRADSLMLISAMIWGFAFVAQYKGMAHIGPFLFNAVRFAMGALVLLPLVLARRPADQRDQRRGWFGGLCMGLALTLGINLQQAGLLFTSVTNSGFITGLYVIIVPLLGLAIGQRVGRGNWSGALLATAGMALLSLKDDFSVAPGDWLQLGGALAWAIHVLLVGHFATRHDALELAVMQFAVCSAASLVLALGFEPVEPQAIARALPALLYAGPVAVGIAYTLQVIAQRHALAAHAAIIFSLEAVFAALAGALLLDERLELRNYLGAVLMFTGMLVAQLWPNGTRAPDRPGAA